MAGHCRLLVEFEAQRIWLYYCNRGGKIIDEESFLMARPLTPEDAIEKASIIHALIYDTLNYGCNRESASVPAWGGIMVKESKRKPKAKKMDENKYAGLSIWEQLRLLSEWSPLLAFGQRFIGEADTHRKAIIVADAAEWLASKTKATADDELVKLLADVLRSPQGEALVRWAVAKAESAK